MIRVLTIITLTIPLSGCLTTQQAYLPDGSLGYEIRCDGTAFSMADCQRQAGEICKSRGYTIYDKNGEAYHTSSAAIGPYGGSAYSGAIVHRSLFLKCGSAQNLR